MKKQTFKLDIEFDSDPFEDLAFLFFHSTDPNYAFADDLNHLYGLALTRVDDMPLLDAAWPVYTYRNTLRQLNYYLIERPVVSGNTALHWGHLHKLLLLQGQDAEETARAIYRDFTTLPDADPQTQNSERNDIITNFQQSFASVTLYDTQLPDGAQPQRKTLRERAELENLFTAIIDHFDLQLLDD